MLFAVNWVYKVLGKTSYYGMDDKNVCSDKLTKWLKDDEHAIILGKSAPPSEETVQNCDIKIGPASGNKNKYLQFEFETFYVKDCDVRLDIEQSHSGIFYNSNQMTSLSCNSEPPDLLYSEEGNNVLLKLQRPGLFNNDYNFRINVTTIPEPPSSHASHLPLIIGGVCAGIILLVLLLFVLLKLLYDRRKRHGKRNTSSRSTAAECDVQYSPRETTAVQVSSGNTDEKHPLSPLLNPLPCSSDHDPGPDTLLNPPVQPASLNGSQPSLPPSYEEATSIRLNAPPDTRPQPSAPMLE